MSEVGYGYWREDFQLIHGISLKELLPNVEIREVKPNRDEEIN